MKIEKINDNQIRCILTREDLEQRQIRLSELAYGSDKAKSLSASVPPSRIPWGSPGGKAVPFRPSNSS